MVATANLDKLLTTLGERVIGESLANSIVDAYLGASVQGGRHQRRRDQLRELESEARGVRREPKLIEGRRTK